MVCVDNSSVIYYTAISQFNGSIARLGKVIVVRYGNDGLFKVLGQLFENIKYKLSAFAIEVTCWPIAHNNLWVVD